ncbi:hypothetical protein HanRHA438_Chr04g0197021 [Helianthus annuus]|nr:hypothetical protein HanRHA438_Chr04g0197021 [Helianthus annuus]
MKFFHEHCSTSSSSSFFSNTSSFFSFTDASSSFIAGKSFEISDTDDIAVSSFSFFLS